MKEVVVNFNTDGTTLIEANGFRGVGCKDATKQIELLLAGTPDNIDSKPKPDFFQSNVGMQTNRIG